MVCGALFSPSWNCGKSFEFDGTCCSLAVNKNSPRKKFEGFVTVPLPTAEKNHLHLNFSD